MEKYVFIINADYLYQGMFEKAGWKGTDKIEEADLVVFTGGEDVSPELYGEKQHPRTWPNPNRDRNETALYKKALELGIPMVGICRGGQFLNVMNGGKMWQHVDNHGINGTHDANVTGFIGHVQVTSTHHQMMIPNEDAEHIVLMTANRSTKKERMDGGMGVLTRYITNRKEDDVESIYYPDTHCLCYQPHPEYHEGKGECRDVFFFFLNNYLLANADLGTVATVITDGILNQRRVEEVIPFTKTKEN